MLLPSLSSAFAPYSSGSTDPIGYVMAYIPVALAIAAMVMAFLSALMYVRHELERRRTATPTTVTTVTTVTPTPTTTGELEPGPSPA